MSSQVEPIPIPPPHGPYARPWWWRYGVAVVAVLVATGARAAVFHFTGERIPFATYLPVVILTTLYAGAGPGLLSILLSVVAASYYMSPFGRFWISGVQQWTSTGAFVLANLLNVWICSAMRRARSDAEIATAAKRRADRALNESEARFRVMADSAPVLIWIADADNRCVWFNQRWLEFTGRPMQQEIGTGWMQNVHPDDLERVKAADSAAFQSREPYELDYRLRRKDGEYRWVLEQGVPLTAGGEFSGYIGTCVDITDRKKIEADGQVVLEREQAARLEAERTSRIKDEFLATLSHELRTPLNAILGWSQIIRPGQTSTKDVAEGLAIIERNARMQTQIISDLLDMSRIISGKILLELQAADLASVITAAIESVQPSADVKGIRITREIDRSMPRIHGDPSRLQQAVWNLLTNAIKFTPRGGHVEVSLTRGHDTAQIVVRDNGQGVDTEFQRHLFQRFRQADASSTRTHGGLGIGLSIVKSLVELHGGTVSCMSDGTGKGSTFTISLPLPAVNARIDGQAVIDNPSRSSPPLNLRGLRVLVVDDEPDSRDLIARLLREHDATVAVASSAATALDVIAQGDLDVLVSDIGMSGMDGYEMIRVVRARGINVPAMALTAFARSEDRTRAMLAGYQSHVAKPVEVGELIATVASLGGRTGREDLAAAKPEV